MFQVLIPRVISGSGAAFLKGCGCQVELGEPVSTDSPVLEQCDAILAGGVSGLRYDEALLKRCRKLKIIACFSVGTEMIDLQAASRLGIYVSNSGTANCNAVAEHTVYLLLCCAKNAERMRFAARHGDFAIRQRVYCQELSGRRLGLIGCGRIGRAVAKKCEAGFDMEVLGYDPYLPAEAFPQEIHPVRTLEELLRNSDFVSVHVPMTDQSRNLIRKEQLRQMKPGAYLINTSRGGIVCEEDLLDALRSGQIAGAALDVFSQEPLEPHSIFTTFDNLIITPHCAANTQEALSRMERYAAEDIWRVLSGGEPVFVCARPCNHRREET